MIGSSQEEPPNLAKLSHKNTVCVCVYEQLDSLFKFPSQDTLSLFISL